MIRQGRAANPLLKEATALQQLHHPNIVRIFGWVERLLCVVGFLSSCRRHCVWGALRTVEGRVATAL
jgi:hypothetical protein